MIENTVIPLSKLIAWDGNVRRTDSDKGIDELAASIAAHGLLQSLVVQKDKKDKFAVVAGRRRLLALQSLAKAKKLSADHSIPCQIIPDEADATEISLTENVQREQMHPADEFEAFRALIDGGMLPADVAARFGVTETVVQKRLKLANVSPKLIDLYRKGEMSLQHIMAFTVTDDHKAQERVWKELPEWNRRNPNTIRDQLTESEVTADDNRVAFVTLDAYRKAGGKTHQDLFSDDDSGVFIEDVALLDKLVAEKLEHIAATVRAEGWKWVEIREAYEYSEWSSHSRVQPDFAPLSAAEQKELDALTEEFDALPDEMDDEQEARCEEIRERMSELEDGEPIWTAEMLSIAGAVVAIGNGGDSHIERGLVRPEDQPKQKGKKAAKATEDADDEKPAYSAALIESLSIQRTAALGTVLAGKPDVALAALVHTLALDLYEVYGHDTCLQVRISRPYLRGVDDAPATKAIEKLGKEWSKKLPKKPDALWDWCFKQKTAELLSLLAFCVAHSVNAVIGKQDRADSSRFAYADKLAKAVKLDMADWFTPTAENYFGKITKPQIVEAIKEIGKGNLLDPAKTSKADAAGFAESKAKGTGWLPELLRTPK